jgi:hypothetical protein
MVIANTTPKVNHLTATMIDADSSAAGRFLELLAKGFFYSLKRRVGMALYYFHIG